MWAGKPPACDHGPRVYRSRIDHAAVLHHLWTCAAEEGQCPEQQITEEWEIR